MNVGRRAMAFDFGLRRIGVAVGQAGLDNGRELTTLAAREGIPDWAAIAALLAEWEPAVLLVGEPLTLDGEEQPMTAAARRFGRRLHGRFGLPVTMVDERLTTRAAHAELGERGQADHDYEDLDRVAARLILETWLHDAAREAS